MKVGRLGAPLAALCLLSASSPSYAQSSDLFTDYGATSVYGQAPAPAPTAPIVPVHEPKPPPFGARGEWVVSGSTSLGGSWQTFDASSARYGYVTISPAVDWFVVRNVSLGLGVSVSFSDQQGYGADASLVDSRSTAVRVGPRIGYALHVARHATFWPQATVGFEWYGASTSVLSGQSQSTAGNALGYPSSSVLGPWVGLDLPLLFDVAPHVLAGVEASVFHDFANVQGGPELGGQETHVSAGFLLGGWFGGPHPDDEEPSPGPTRLPRFGEAGHVVVSNELVMDASWTGYSGTASSNAGGALGAGIDWFPTDGFSIGAFAGVQASSSRGIDATTGDTINGSGHGEDVGFRVGVNVPLGDHASWWPRASLAYSTSHVDETDTAAGTNLANDELASVISLDAPVLVHPSTHFFFGFGPTVSRDLSRSIVASSGGSSGPGVQNTSTTVGASAIVGAWF